MREDNYIPLYMRSSADREPLKAEVIPSRKELFAALNAFVTERHGWLTSIPGCGRRDDGMPPGLIAAR